MFQFITPKEKRLNAHKMRKQSSERHWIADLIFFGLFLYNFSYCAAQKGAEEIFFKLIGEELVEEMNTFKLNFVNKSSSEWQAHKFN